MTALARRGVIIRAAIALAALVGGLAGLPAGASNHASAGVTVDRTFMPTVTPPGFVNSKTTPYAQTLTLAAAPSAQVLYGVDERAPGFISAYNLGTLRPLSSDGLVLDGTVSAFTVLPGDDGLLVAVSASGQSQPTTSIEQVAWSGGRLRVLSRLATPAGSLGPAQLVVGFGVDARHHDVFALSVASSTGGSYVPGTVQLSLLDRPAHAKTLKLLWRQPLPNCQLPIATTPAGPRQTPAPLGVLRSGRVLDVGCAAQGSAGIYKPPTPVGVGAVRLNPGKHPSYGGFELFPYPGDVTQSLKGLWFPREERLVFQVRDNSTNNTGWVVFDGEHNAYVGTIPVGANPDEVGADLVHGRLYLLDNSVFDGLRTADVGPTPVDQGHTYPQFASDKVNEDSNYGVTPEPAAVTTDPGRKRVFVLYNSSRMFVVLRDSVGYFTRPAPTDPDQNTRNIAEKRGVTAANWTGSAQGYGSVIRQVGGASSLQYNYVPVTLNANQSGTQQLATSYLGTLQLTGGDARASAMTAVPDNGPTTATLGQAGLKWPYNPASCDDGGATKAAKVDNAEVACDSAAGSVTAAVVGGAAGAGASPKAADVVVSSTALTARSTAALGHGVTTTVESVARGVSVLGGALQIGRIAATASVHAGGRPGTAHSTYSRTLSNVVLAGQQLCASSCDPKDVATRVNDALAGRMAVTFPTPDRRLAAGSPGGYQSLVRRDVFGETEETQLNEQDPNRAEVPAMELTIFEDNTVKSRTVAYLAGVEAEAHYGIYRLSCSTCSTDSSPANQPPDNSAKSPPVGDGPAPSLPGTQTGVTPAPQVAAQANGVVGALRHGWQLLTNGISEVIRLFGVWLLLLAPVYLSARRWLLLNKRSRP